MDQCRRQLERELQDAVIQQWGTGLERARHRGAIDLRQDGVRQVGQQIDQHRSPPNCLPRHDLPRAVEHVEVRQAPGERAYFIGSEDGEQPPIDLRQWQREQRRPSSQLAGKLRQHGHEQFACRTEHARQMRAELEVVVARIPAEGLVATVAGKADRHVAPCGPRHQICRQRGRVGERLAIHSRDRRDDARASRSVSISTV